MILEVSTKEVAMPAERSFPAHTASLRGPRTVNADAVGAFTDPLTGSTVVALADGVGDDAAASRAARLAASAAARTPAHLGPVVAIKAAQAAVTADATAGDCVLVVAMPTPDGGFRIGWVGDARAHAWDGQRLRLLTTDHTLAQFFRTRGQPTTPPMEHVVTTSVRTAAPKQFGLTHVAGPAGMLLTSDGVHKRLTAETMAEVLVGGSISALVETAITVGGSDNATAIVVEPPPNADGPTVAFHLAAA
ncbi:hypothetical protein HUW46_07009 [Amycolatopsis sp. CA-230715]|nr:hypothetical protein HUW46_07009 [Amycolatopsis sp. CA-230715]